MPPVGSTQSIDWPLMQLVCAVRMLANHIGETPSSLSSFAVDQTSPSVTLWEVLSCSSTRSRGISGTVVVWRCWLLVHRLIILLAHLCDLVGRLEECIVLRNCSVGALIFLDWAGLDATSCSSSRLSSTDTCRYHNNFHLVDWETGLEWWILVYFFLLCSDHPLNWHHQQLHQLLLCSIWTRVKHPPPPLHHYNQRSFKDFCMRRTKESHCHAPESMPYWMKMNSYPPRTKHWRTICHRWQNYWSFLNQATKSSSFSLPPWQEK